MQPLNFTYDPAKAKSNLRKHGVSFAEAETVFLDPLASTLPDDQHSIDEQRYITVGTSSQGRVLFVVYTETESTVRIGARLATATERHQYEEVG
ncbi:BrnT family toxin [Terriglobus sp. RCC_193]|uniref:BrnT family toxin n=1 Tax=Terriglobus sp. RCC_193 TaxID=3239218 RepID=UPI0035247678